MPASTGLDVFGPADTPHVKEILPQALLSRKHSDSPTILGYSDEKWHSADEKCMVKCSPQDSPISFLGTGSGKVWKLFLQYVQEIIMGE